MIKEDKKFLISVILYVVLFMAFILSPIIAYITSGASLDGSGAKGRGCQRCGYDGEIYCLMCGGDGIYDCINCAGLGFKLCNKCGGSGSTRCYSCMGIGYMFRSINGEIVEIECTSCGADGQIECPATTRCYCEDGETTCSTCDGTGMMDCPECTKGSE